MRGTITTQSITFFNNEIAAAALAAKNGGADEGFVVAPAVGRPGKFVIKIIDADDATFLGYL